MRIENGFTFFWRSRTPFSNWFMEAPFVVDGVFFTTNEHYMMWSKAKLFGDEETAAKILLTSKPSVAKQLGREVKGFDKAVWDAQAIDIVAEGAYHKFSQNVGASQALLDTIGTELVEASPDDPIWGVGLPEEDDRILDRKNWVGTNWLGQALMKARDRIVRGLVNEGEKTL